MYKKVLAGVIMLTESELLIQQSIAAWLEANDFQSHYPILVSLKELRDCTGVGDLAVLWTIAEIVAAANRDEPGKLAKYLREKVEKRTYPQPIPRLLVAELERTGEIPEFQALMGRTGHTLESLIKRLKTPLLDVTESELPPVGDVAAYFRANQPAPPEWSMSHRRKMEYLEYASSLLLYEDRELAEIAACSVGYGYPSGIYDLMKRIISLQGKGILPTLLRSPHPSVRSAAAWPGIDREAIWPLLHDPDSLVRALAVNAMIRDLMKTPFTGDSHLLLGRINKEAHQVGDLHYADQLNYFYLFAVRFKHYLRYIYPSRHMPLPRWVQLIVSVGIIGLSGLAMWLLDGMVKNTGAALRVGLGGIAALTAAALIGCWWRREKSKVVRLLKQAGRYWPGLRLDFRALENKPGLVDNDYFAAVIVYGTRDGLECHVVNENTKTLRRIYSDGRSGEKKLDQSRLQAWRNLKHQFQLYRNYMLQMRHCGVPRAGYVIINALYSRPGGLKPLIMTIEEKIDGESLAHGIFRQALPELLGAEHRKTGGGAPVRKESRKKGK